MDLSNITKNDLILDTPNKNITLTLSSPQVFSINIDENKTIYAEPELGFFRFGDIDLTSEEYGDIRAKIYETFKEKMNSSELHDKVISNTTTSLENLIEDLTGENYSINIKIKNI